ncbi:hypothetical protein RB595_000594 [Gaeumannomyces hyphopodioides]
MRFTSPPVLLAYIYLFANLASASVMGHARRQEITTSSSVVRTSLVRTNAPVPTANTTNALPSTTTTLAPSASSTGVTFNDTMFNLTIPEGQLPLEPSLTPGWGVAGTIMLLTGAVYAFIGIKMQSLHTFFSTAYLTALSTAVLIVYVMTPPVADGIQGAYVVAVVLTGAILGGIAIIFKEITECLGCLLGGFCLSMWLLALREGGLVTDLGGKIGFIAAFCAVTFGLYFSNWTRTYALIGCTSFSGATAAVLGIDAFSRAGLKEFWAYIWNLNDRLFPLGAVTYPLTKGMRVELAATIVLFIAGVVSQLKLWVLIKQHREKREAEQLEARREMDEEEAAVGRKIERANARERRNWEAIYGDGTQQDDNEGDAHARSHVSMDSGVAVASVPSENGSGSPKTQPGQVVEEHIEMVALQPPVAVALPAEPQAPKTAAEAVLAHDKECGVLTVQVGAEEEEELEEELDAAIPDEQVDESDVHPALRKLRRVPNSLTPTEGPVVVPLPFKIPTVEESEAKDGNDDRSSVATMDAGDEETRSVAVPSKRGSLAKRLSQSSIDILRGFSQRSKRSAAGVSRMPSASREELVMSRATVRSSVAATMDGMSEIEDDEEEEEPRDKASVTIEVVADLADKPKKRDSLSAADALDGHKKHISMAETVSTDILNIPTENKDKAEDESSGAAGATVEKASLTRERLPKAMSKVAMSYRTNEWAKHLSMAEVPQPDELHIAEATKPDAATVIPAANEAAVPVKVEELQQTAENGAPEPAPARPASTVVRQSMSQDIPVWHSGTAANRAPPHSVSAAIYPITPDPVAPASTRTSISGSQPGLARTVSISSSMSRYAPAPGVVSYSSPQTLIGQRDTLLRQKSNPGFPGAMPEPSSVYMHDSAMHSPYVVMPPAPVETADDLPLSQRRQLIMRHNSQLSMGSHGEYVRTTTPSLYGQAPSRAPSVTGSYYGGFGMPQQPTTLIGAVATTTTVPFNSHQPQRDRSSHIQSAEARAVQMASFRNSVAADMRASAATTAKNAAQGGMMDLQRNAMLSQKEAEGQRREAERLERERSGRAFDEMMRRSDMLDVHRDAMRRMQAAARDS